VENRRLKLFVAVAEELHFTRASVRLRIAQPHLSQEIRRLEREIGVELFARTKRSVSLTPAGSVFLERVRIVLDYTADAMRAAQRASRGEVGRIRVGFTRVPAIGVIPDAIVRFRSAYPDRQEGWKRAMRQPEAIRRLLGQILKKSADMAGSAPARILGEIERCKWI
jgi:DNA-binding transcriptional LysR family regulator